MTEVDRQLATRRTATIRAAVDEVGRSNCGRPAELSLIRYRGRSRNLGLEAGPDVAVSGRRERELINTQHRKEGRFRDG